jgi:hypothetical protein
MFGGSLGHTVLVMLFGASCTGGLFLAFWYEAVTAAACQIFAWEVELETAAHLALHIVDLGIAQQVGTLLVGDYFDAFHFLN